MAPTDADGGPDRRPAEFCAGDDNAGAGQGGTAKLASAPSPSPAPAAVAGTVLEVMLPDGARVRLEGAVDPTLAAAVLRALATSGRAP